MRSSRTGQEESSSSSQLPGDTFSVFRGFLEFYLAALGLSAPFIVLIGAIVFGMAHAYQGRLGVVQTGALGGVLMVLFLLCGSVVPGMVCHALIDLRILAIFRPQRATQPASVE